MLRIGVITMALMSFLHAGWLGNLFDSTPTPPISIPIDLSKAGSVAETEVRIKEKRSYSFILDFSYIDPKKDGGLDANKVQKFIGFNGYDLSSGKQFGSCNYEFAKSQLGYLIDETYNCDGTIVPVEIFIYKLGKNNQKELFFTKYYVTKGTGTSSSLDRDFGALWLDIGHYSISIKNIEAFSEMNGRNVNFIIRMNKRIK